MFDFELEIYTNRIKILQQKISRMKMSLFLSVAFVAVWIPFFILMLKVKFNGNALFIFQFVFLLVTDLVGIAIFIYKIKQLNKELEKVKKEMLLEQIKMNTPKPNSAEECEIFEELKNTQKEDDELLKIKNEIIDDIFN